MWCGALKTSHFDTFGKQEQMPINGRDFFLLLFFVLFCVVLFGSFITDGWVVFISNAELRHFYYNFVLQIFYRDTADDMSFNGTKCVLRSFFGYIAKEALRHHFK